MIDLRTAELQTKAVEVSEKERSIVHFITTPDIDWGGDVVDPFGMDDSNFQKSPTVFYNHDYNLPIAKSLWRKPKDEGVLAKTQFSKKTLFADDIYQLHKEGIINTWSIGWMPTEDENSTTFDKEKNILYINKWYLYEYSSAPLAMNPNALDQIKSIAKSIQLKNTVKDIEIYGELKENVLELSDQVKALASNIKELREMGADIDKLEKDYFELQKLLIKSRDTSGFDKSYVDKIIAGEVQKAISKI